MSARFCGQCKINANMVQFLKSQDTYSWSDWVTMYNSIKSSVKIYNRVHKCHKGTKTRGKGNESQIKWGRLLARGRNSSRSQKKIGRIWLTERKGKNVVGLRKKGNRWAGNLIRNKWQSKFILYKSSTAKKCLISFISKVFIWESKVKKLVFWRLGIFPVEWGMGENEREEHL